MDDKQGVGNELDNADLLEEIRQLRQEVANVKPRRGLVRRVRDKSKACGAWLINGLAPVGEADQVREESTVVQFLAKRMRTRRGKALILAISAAVFVFWVGLVLAIMM
ncbi:hypothetical protein [Glutamicibacter arilaitensis]|uniref:hypothetical protein n=1 Tax=Glutamicibacter TaxID=1742989 RepID=UPI003F91213C